MKIATIFAIAAAMTMAATPAFAKSEGRFGEGKVTYNPRSGKYCIRFADPGSIMLHSICRTADAWADAGLTITRKPATQLAER
ncbi:hypothetical protein CAF53_10655 [Sphingobium sp. LB126]|uniref:hypothetical protein n=1 Tax=Sphingobium sp. LB126 TaxID=1983755 RepID=UPI000C2015CF|nr:hypothetical protein [Sphingobium sp. LB126]PJG48644.1 hypothetical protein CAF53_10655 [Sphingobium sp. LB126]